MAMLGCDFTEQLWQSGKTEQRVMATNRNGSTVVIYHSTVIGTVEEVSQVNQDDRVWEEAPVPDTVVRMCASQHGKLGH